MLEWAEEVVSGISKKAYRAVNDLGIQVETRRPLTLVLSQCFDPVLERLESLVKPFKPNARELRQNIRYFFEKTFPERLNTLDTQLSLYPKQLADTYESLQPYTDQMLTLIRQGAEALNKNLKPYFKPFLDENQKYQAEFREWVDTPTFPQNASLISSQD